MILGNTDSVAENLYYLLWIKDAGLKDTRFKVRLPDTVMLKGRQMTSWYFTSSKEIILKKKTNALTIDSVWDSFTENVGKSGVVAQLIWGQGRKQGTTQILEKAHKINESARKSERVVIKYLDVNDLHKLLYEELPNKEDLEETMILQKFIDPYGESNSMIEAVWSPSTCVFTRCVNNKTLNNQQYDVYERAVTFDGPQVFSSRACLKGKAISGEIRSLCENIVKRVAHVTYEKVMISRMTLYFKPDHDNKLFFLFCTSLRLRDEISSAQQQSFVYNNTPLQIENNFIQPPNMRNTYSLTQTKAARLTNDVPCLHCKNIMQLHDMVEMPLQLLFRDLNQDKPDGETEINNPKEQQPPQQSKFKKEKRVEVILTHSQMMQHLAKVSDNSPFNLENTKAFMGGDDQPPPHPLFRLLYPKMTKESFYQLYSQGYFKRAMIYLCYNCYFHYTQDSVITGAPLSGREDLEGYKRNLVIQHSRFTNEFFKKSLPKHLDLASESQHLVHYDLPGTYQKRLDAIKEMEDNMKYQAALLKQQQQQKQNNYGDRNDKACEEEESESESNASNNHNHSPPGHIEMTASRQFKKINSYLESQGGIDQRNQINKQNAELKNLKNKEKVPITVPYISAAANRMKVLELIGNAKRDKEQYHFEDASIKTIQTCKEEQVAEDDKKGKEINVKDQEYVKQERSVGQVDGDDHNEDLSEESFLQNKQEILEMYLQASEVRGEDRHRKNNISLQKRDYRGVSGKIEEQNNTQQHTFKTDTDETDTVSERNEQQAEFQQVKNFNSYGLQPTTTAVTTSRMKNSPRSQPTATTSSHSILYSNAGYNNTSSAAVGRISKNSTISIQPSKSSRTEETIMELSGDTHNPDKLVYEEQKGQFKDTKRSALGFLAVSGRKNHGNNNNKLIDANKFLAVGLTKSQQSQQLQALYSPYRPNTSSSLLNNRKSLSTIKEQNKHKNININICDNRLRTAPFALYLPKATGGNVQGNNNNNSNSNYIHIQPSSNSSRQQHLIESLYGPSPYGVSLKSARQKRSTPLGNIYDTTGHSKEQTTMQSESKQFANTSSSFFKSHDATPRRNLIFEHSPQHKKQMSLSSQSSQQKQQQQKQELRQQAQLEQQVKGKNDRQQTQELKGQEKQTNQEIQQVQQEDNQSQLKIEENNQNNNNEILDCSE